MKKNNSSIITDVNSSFEKDISLHRFIGQRISIDVMKVVIEQICNDRADGRNPEIPSILMVGPTGKKTLAQAIHNTVGNLDFRTTTGHSLGMWQSCDEFFLAADENSTLYISSGESLSVYTQNIIHKIISEKIFCSHDPLEGRTDIFPFPNCLIILSTTDKKRIISPLVKAIDIHCYLTKYTENELYQIVKQRCDYLGWDYETNEVLNIVARNSNGIAGLGTRILQMSYRIMRSVGKNTLTENHVNRGILFVQSGKDR